MERPEVSVFIETTYKGPERKDGAAMWIVEYRKKNGELVTREGKVHLKDSTENQITLTAIAAALSILEKTCSVRVSTRCGHVLGMVKNNWPQRWEKAGWINAKGRPVANAREWQQVMAVLKRHSYTFQSGPHAYQEVMLWDLGREKEGTDGKEHHTD